MAKDIRKRGLLGFIGFIEFVELTPAYRQAGKKPNEPKKLSKL